MRVSWGRSDGVKKCQSAEQDRGIRDSAFVKDNESARLAIDRIPPTIVH